MQLDVQQVRHQMLCSSAVHLCCTGRQAGRQAHIGSPHGDVTPVCALPMQLHAQAARAAPGQAAPKVRDCAAATREPAASMQHIVTGRQLPAAHQLQGATAPLLTPKVASAERRCSRSSLSANSCAMDLPEARPTSWHMAGAPLTSRVAASSTATRPCACGEGVSRRLGQGGVQGVSGHCVSAGVRPAG
jgi:hypothetical protein